MKNLKRLLTLKCNKCGRMVINNETARAEHILDHYHIYDFYEKEK